MKRKPWVFFLVLRLELLALFLISLHASEGTPTGRKEAVNQYYSFWKGKYLIPSVRFPGEWKVNYDGMGATVSEAMGYGMLITACMADTDPEAKKYFDGLDAFRKHFPSSINHACMCWKIPANEKPRKDDSATDGDLDMAYALLLAHQRWGEGFASKTGLVPDFAVQKEGRWIPAKPGFLEGRDDGDYYYNACRVPWRIGWAALALDDARARQFLKPFMGWVSAIIPSLEEFRSGYHLEGLPVRNSDFDTACFISPIGVAAMALQEWKWGDTVFTYAEKKHEEYYSDSVNLLCMILMSEKTEKLQWRP